MAGDDEDGDEFVGLGDLAFGGQFKAVNMETGETIEAGEGEEVDELSDDEARLLEKLVNALMRATTETRPGRMEDRKVESWAWSLGALGAAHAMMLAGMMTSGPAASLEGKERERAQVGLMLRMVQRFTSMVAKYVDEFEATKGHAKAH